MFRMVDLGSKIPRLRRRQIGAECEELENELVLVSSERPSRGVGIWTRRGGSSAAGNREERVGVKVSKSKRWGRRESRTCGHVELDHEKKKISCGK